MVGWSGTKRMWKGRLQRMLSRKRSFNRPTFSPTQLAAFQYISVLVHKKGETMKIIRAVTVRHKVIKEMSVKR